MILRRFGVPGRRLFCIVLFVLLRPVIGGGAAYFRFKHPIKLTLTVIADKRRNFCNTKIRIRNQTAGSADPFCFQHVREGTIRLHPDHPAQIGDGIVKMRSDAFQRGGLYVFLKVHLDFRNQGRLI